MARFTLVTPLLLFALILASVSEGLAGASCARRYEGSSTCTEKCTRRWGYPGRAMGTDAWGHVMARTDSDMSTVLRKACRVRPTSSTANVSSSTSSAIQTSLGVANVGGALPSFSAVTITSSSSEASASVSSTKESSSSASSATTQSVTSHVLAPASSSRFLTSIRSATSPSPSPSPKETPSPEAPASSPHSTAAAVTSAAPQQETTSAAPAKTETQAKAQTTKTTSTAQVTAAGSSSSASGSGTSSSDISQYLSAHNTIRSQHGASALTWSDELASKAQQWANGCVFQHSGGTLGAFGENLAAGTGSSYDIAAAVKSWTDEVSEYNSNSPVPSHFTQVVWKASTQVGCAVQQCSGIFAASFGLAKFFVCEYSVQGNVIGEFAQNVQV